MTKPRYVELTDEDCALCLGEGLWKQGRIVPTGRDSAGHIIWQATPGGDAN